MRRTYSFKFADDRLNERLITLLERAKVKHFVDKKGAIHYSGHDEELVENHLIRTIRDQLYPSWQILSCPPDWTKGYKRYMTQHDVPFTEELIDNQLCFLIPRKYRPHSWKLHQRSESDFRLAR